MEADGALKYQSGQDVLDEKVREDAIHPVIYRKNAVAQQNN